MLYNDRPRMKYLTVGGLKKLLQLLPEEFELHPTATTGNLTILKDGDVIGQVCFLQDGKVDFFYNFYEDANDNQGE